MTALRLNAVEVRLTRAAWASIPRGLKTRFTEGCQGTFAFSDEELDDAVESVQQAALLETCKSQARRLKSLSKKLRSARHYCRCA